MDIQLLNNTWVFVSHAPYFWPSMGMTTAIAMFIGAMVYDGELNQLKKGLLSVGSYALMLLWLTLTRVLDLVDRAPDTISERTFAGTLTILMVTFFWILGVYIGVCLISIKYKGKHISR